jgi:hypothetical protein
MAVKILLQLDNTQFKQGLDESLQNAIDFGNKVQAATGQAPDFDIKLGTAAPAINETTNSARGLAEAIHILNPILGEAGIHIADLGGFARLARGSVEALGIALAGAVVAGLATLEDNAAQAQLQLSNLFRSTDGGQQSFAALSQSAKQFGVTAASLVPTLTSIQLALEQIGTGPKFVTLGGDAASSITILTNFNKLLQATGLDFTQAETVASKFFDTMSKGGKVTSDTLRALPVGTIDFIAQALGKGSLNTAQFLAQVNSMNISVRTLLQIIQSSGGIIDQLFDAKAIITFRDVLRDLLTTLQTGFQQIAGTGFSDFLVKALRTVQIEIRTSADQWIAFQELLAKPAGTGFGDFFARIKEISEAEKQALTDLDNLQKKAAEPIKPGAIFLVPPPEEIPIPTVDPRKAAAAVQPEVDANEQARKEVDTLWDQPITGPTGFAPSPDELKSQWQELFNWLQQLFSQPITLNIQTPQFTAPGGAPFASGGLVIGPGTGTSDSILARLSNMEFVMNSRATSFYGPNFMAALNSLIVPRDILPGFSMGGLARAIGAMPGFALGGLNSGLRPITINIAGKGSFAGSINAPEHVVAMLSSEAVFEQLAAGGRSPGWRRT